MNGDELRLIQEDKQRLRRELADCVASLSEPGKVAQQLRGFPPYRRAARIYVSPAMELSQIRINCLIDGKELIMPGPALKDGLFGFKPYSITFTDLAYAVSFKGVKKYGKLLDLSKRQAVDLFLTDGFVLNHAGIRLGEGNGFFDLSFAVLSWSDPGNVRTRVGMVCNEEQVMSLPLPQAPWDVDMDFYISSKGWRELLTEEEYSGSRRAAGPIFWQQLTAQRIKKVSPLWKIWKNKS